MINRPSLAFYFKHCLILLFTVIVSACASNKLENINTEAFVINQKEAIPAMRNVLVINSNRSVERYSVAETTYINSLGRVNTTVLNLESENQPIEYLQDVLNHNDYDIIYCIGAKALGSIDFIDPNKPVVYSAVLNWRKFKERKNYYGIASELSPQVQLTWFKYFFPEIKSIGVFYSDENQSLIDDAQHAAGNLALNIKAFKISHDQQLILSAEKLLSKVDALWLISDSSTLSSIKNINGLFKIADKLKVPVITYNPVFMDVGAMMSLVADLPTTARQAAILTMKLLEKNQPKDSIQFPAGSRIILSNEKVKDYEVKLNIGSLDSVDELQ